MHLRPVHLLTLALLALATAASARQPQLPAPLRRESFSLSLSAPTIPALVAKARPTLITTHDQPLFIWIRPHKFAFAFTVAAAAKLPDGNWSILSTDGHATTAAFFPRTTITRAVEKPSTLNPGSYIAQLASHPTHGTLYQLSLGRFEGCLQFETRLFLLRSPAGQWRYVGHAPGPGGDDGSWAAVDSTRITWTRNPAAPLNILLTYHLNPPEAYNDRPDPRTYLQRFSTTSLAGPLPTKPLNSHDFLLPKPGDTFPQLVTRLASAETYDKSPATLRAARARLTPALLKLNPALTPSRLPAHTPLYLPDWEQMTHLCNP